MEEAEKIVVIREFDDVIAANICKTKLDAYGIPCFLTEENLASLYPGNQFIAFKVRLHVFLKDTEEADHLLREASMHKDDGSSITCPECNSPRLERDFPKRFYDKTLSALGVLFFGIFIPQKKIYRCLDCHQEFDQMDFNKI
jgi:DNA-directed RNA polymerase subunit RPC12/RpoP